MNREDVMDLARLSFRDPPAAAKAILALGFSREVLWTALALVAAVNAILLQVLVVTAGPQQTLPAFFNTPLAAFVLIGGMMVIFVHALYWAGLAMGGKGSLLDLLALIVWLQVLRSALQAGIILLSLLVPVLAAIATLAAVGWSVWALLSFLIAALHLSSYGQALVVVIIGSIGLFLGLGILLVLVGLVSQGTQAHV